MTLRPQPVVGLHHRGKGIQDAVEANDSFRFVQTVSRAAERISTCEFDDAARHDRRMTFAAVSLRSGRERRCLRSDAMQSLCG